MNFDEIIDRQGTHSSKWDKMEPIYGVPASTGIAMWVADMDFRPPVVVQDALQGMLDHGIYGYFGDDSKYLNAIQWWMDNRHGWKIDPEWVFTTHGLVNGTAMRLPSPATALFFLHQYITLSHASLLLQSAKLWNVRWSTTMAVINWILKRSMPR